MGIKLLFFTGFSKFVAHESVAFMFVLFGCYSRCLLIFFWGGFGVSPKTLFELHAIPKRIYLGTDYTDFTVLVL